MAADLADFQPEWVNRLTPSRMTVTNCPNGKAALKCSRGAHSASSMARQVAELQEDEAMVGLRTDRYNADFAAKVQ
jgi:hypothetical protein